MGQERAKKQAHPTMVVYDQRQQSHRYGIFYLGPGSYSEPLGGDENPETLANDIWKRNFIATPAGGWRSIDPTPSFFPDEYYADFLRRPNVIYAAQQLLPSIRMPGFVFHQTERKGDYLVTEGPLGEG